MQPIAISNRKILEEVIKKDEYAVGALIQVYQNQTPDEQMVNGTVHQNGEGFNGVDSNFCSSLAKQYLDKGKLTTRQLGFVKEILPKYHSQIQILKPLTIKKTRKRTNKPSQKQEKKVVLTGDTLYITFPFDFETVSLVKLLSGRRWNSTKKQWTCPVSVESLDDLISWGFKLSKRAKKWYDSQVTEIKPVDTIPGLRAQLYPYQQDGISFIQSKNGRAIVGDEMGLGKTLQALGWMQLNKEKDIFPALIICPSSLKLNWSKETLKFTDLEPAIVSGKCKKKITTIPGYNNPNVFIINYDIIHEMVECPICKGTGSNRGNKCKNCAGKGKVAILDTFLKKMKFKTVVMDECHYTKNNKAGRTQACLELSKSCDNVIGLSGTPIVNRPIEFFNIIQMVNDKIFPSWWKYTSRYCNRHNNGFGMDVTGSSNTNELHERLSKTVMIRRLKKDVLTELPPKVRTTIPIEINKKQYDRIIEETKQELKDNPAAHLAIIERAKQTVVNLKMKSSLDWIQDYIDNDEKLVVFANHREVIETVHSHFKKESVVVYGGTDNDKRQAAVDRFQIDLSCKLFIGSMAAKEGLTLTAAKATCFLELWWEPGAHSQAEDRVHRIGQEADSVFAYYLLAAGTIEEDIAELLDSKRQVLSSVLDGKDAEQTSMLTELMKRINEEE